MIKLLKLLNNSQCVLLDTFLVLVFLPISSFLCTALRSTLHNIALIPHCDLFLHYHVFSTYSGRCEILMVSIPQPWHRENKKEKKGIKEIPTKTKRTNQQANKPKQPSKRRVINSEGYIYISAIPALGKLFTHNIYLFLHFFQAEGVSLFIIRIFWS